MQPKCRGDKIEQPRCFMRGGNKQKLRVYYWSEKPKAIIHDARSVGNKFVSKFLHDQNRGWSDELEPTQWNVVLIFLLCVPQPLFLSCVKLKRTIVVTQQSPWKTRDVSTSKPISTNQGKDQRKERQYSSEDHIKKLHQVKDDTDVP